MLRTKEIYNPIGGVRGVILEKRVIIQNVGLVQMVKLLLVTEVNN
ncbi:hypothetical protein SYNTR_1182 [Candidatus Syntrophocurvum alkaliphilum]|uniref:Uncharacterized protein n=1 Tax=Candidatus Syntrophocurvum alkaliphilum TaxID=2293317 RepID=A0A6I6DAN3_9FIRM|nr:hypothetical protein [Candidatus Syntrophocurvum alkaliphilum]QGT99775.1 hypothetical protein SYNTR_1182 [Candidatus Syntrophocurvum alkaliphilum]